MSIFAGVFARRPHPQLPTGALDELRRAISRRHGETVSMHSTDRVALVEVEVAKLDASYRRIEQAGAVTVIAGQPLLEPGPMSDTERLHTILAARDWTALRGARGTYCAAHIEEGPPASLTLVADRLGVRPLYYWVGDEVVVFATALRILEELSFVPKVLDVRAATESVAFDFPLGDRTPYVGIRVLLDGELATIDGTSARRERYWRWSDCRVEATDPAQTAAELHAVFMEGIDRRANGDGAANAFLSGGLDSRTIVAALRERGLQVSTFNFSDAGAQDALLGAAFAQAAGAQHHERRPGPGPVRWSAMMADALAESPDAARERPRIVWSGDGGSVGLGHVYLTPPIVAALQAGDRDGAARAFLAGEQIAVPRRLIRPELRARLGALPFDAVREELAAQRTGDAIRDFYLFLMANDQRRHLVAHFEAMDEHRLEFQLPFFDAAFIERVVRSPGEQYLYHRMYTRWLRHFPPSTTSVPWQTYPGHDPCPLPLPADASYQWDARDSTARRRARAARLAHRRGAAAVLRSPSFAAPLLDRSFLWTAVWVERLRLRDMCHVLAAAESYQAWWDHSGGTFAVLPEA